MAKRFEFHLRGMDAPEGFIDADRLVEIVKSLQEMATRIGRFETDAARRGRPDRNVHRVASLRISLAKGSTTILAERDTSAGALDVDLPDEEAVDRRFAELIESIGADERPDWVPDALARSADNLVAALQKAAPTVEFVADGVTRTSFETKVIHRETWKTAALTRMDDEVSFTGVLYYVDLHAHRLQVEDDAGNRVVLPEVDSDREIGPLVGSYVTVTGLPEVDEVGKLTRIAEASVTEAPDPLDLQRLPASVPLEDILRSAPGPSVGGIAALTEAEVDAFLQAIR